MILHSTKPCSFHTLLERSQKYPQMNNISPWFFFDSAALYPGEVSHPIGGDQRCLSPNPLAVKSVTPTNPAVAFQAQNSFQQPLYYTGQQPQQQPSLLQASSCIVSTGLSIHSNTMQKGKESWHFLAWLVLCETKRGKTLPSNYTTYHLLQF